jgi:hypothetical protein
MIPFANAEEAAQARQRIAEGAQFLDIATEKGLSEDDATLGELSRGQLPDPAFAEAAFALDEGEVSQPVEGRLSTALLRVTSVIPADRQPLSEVRDDLVRQLQTERGREEVLDFYDEIEDARAGGQTFEEVAADLDLTVVTVVVDRSGVMPDGETADLPASDEVLRTAFDLDVGIEADPVSTDDDGYVWVDVRDIAPASVMSFEVARDEAQDAWMQRQRSEAVLERARELKAQAESGTPLEELARQVGNTVRSATDIARGSQTEALGRDAVQALFAAPENGFAVALAQDGESAKVMRSSPVLGQVVSTKLVSDLETPVSAMLKLARNARYLPARIGGRRRGARPLLDHRPQPGPDLARRRGQGRDQPQGAGTTPRARSRRPGAAAPVAARLLAESRIKLAEDAPPMAAGRLRLHGLRHGAADGGAAGPTPTRWACPTRC